MNRPLTAGEPLAPPQDRDGRSARKRKDKPPRRGQGGRGQGGPLGWFGRVIGAVLGLAALVAVCGGIAGYGAYRHFSADLPDVEGLRHYQPRVMSRVYSGDERLVAELATERRIFVPYSAIPPLVKQAFVSAEDQNFWNHHGIDPLAILRALVTDMREYGKGRRPVGASTITQQVAKNILLGNEVSLSRKIREALLALRIENALPKERILELYLNEIYLGEQAYGVAAAAQAYFNKSLDDLTLPEAAFLAALPKAPNNYNPFRFPDAARARRDWVLDRMADDRAVTAEQMQAAKAQPVTPANFRRPETVPGAEWFAEEVRRQLITQFGADDTTQGGLMVHTSLVPALQAAADSALRQGLMEYDRTHGGWRGAVTHLDLDAAKHDWPAKLAQVARPPGMLPAWKLAVVTEATDTQAKLGWLDHAAADAAQHTAPMLLADLAWARPLHDGKPGAAPHRIADVLTPGDVVMAEPAAASAKLPERLSLRQIPAVQGALVSLEPATGRVVAMSGGWSAEMSQFNRATQANRQPGSSFKPIVYLTALQKGIEPSQRFLDAPFVVDQGAAGRWRPNNYEMDFLGPVPLRVALEKSLNLVTIRVADRVGMEAVAQNAIAFHVVDDMPRVLPGALGAVETTVMRMAGAYASFAEGGREVRPTLVDTVQDRQGHVVWRAPAVTCAPCDDPAAPPVLEDTRRQIADPASVFQLVTMMQGVVQRGTGTKAAAGLNHVIAGKTGTSQDFNDAWFIGFTPDVVTAVWIGFDNPASLGNNETGGNVAAPVWHDYMAVALKNRPSLNFFQPPGVNMVRWDTGFGSVTDAFKTNTGPGSEQPVDTSSEATDAAAPSASAAAGAAPGSVAHAPGLDSGLGGLY